MDSHQILSRMTVEEKIKLCSGADFWHTKDLSHYGLNRVMMCDGPHGLRCQKGKTDILGIHKALEATCFPTASLSACSWDPRLVGQIGQAIAREAAANGVAMVLGPGVNIKRDPLCGRNFEYFSEDPCLAGELGTAFIQKAQSCGVGTSLKHFALNNQEYKRCSGDSQADERTMREIYLAAFEKPVREGKPDTVMCAYNKVNGTYCSDSKYLLAQVLREEWGFDGAVVTDWGAMHHRIAAMEAGCDLMMPGGSDYMEKQLLHGVKSGALSEQALDRCALRILKLMEKGNTLKAEACDLQAHHTLARKAAGSSAVLLKNQGGLLPLKPDAQIALIGIMADKPRYQGAGSSHINPVKLISAREAIPHKVYAPGCREDGQTNEKLLRQAVEAAQSCHTAVIFAGLPDTWESEGFDRESMKMPEGHIRLIEAVAQVNPRVVVMLCCGGAVECPWIEQVPGAVYMGLAGQSCGEAAADVLFGRVNPSGRLAETWPLIYEDCPTAGNYKGICHPQYREGIYVGYRYYDKADVPVRFPFGYGLSYTEFSWSDLKIEGNTVSCTVENVGNCAGAEVVQLYIAPPGEGLHRPVQELKGFEKVYLEPGQRKQVRFSLTPRSFALWDGGWKVPGGEYELRLSAHSRKIQLKGSLFVEGPSVAAPAWQKGSWYENPVGKPDREQWLAMYGEMPTQIQSCKGSFTVNSTLQEMLPCSLLARLMYWGIKTGIAFSCGPNYRKNPSYWMLLASATDIPLRNMQICSGLHGGIFLGLVCIVNGQYRKALRQLFARSNDSLSWNDMML